MKLAKRLGVMTLASAMTITSIPVVAMAGETMPIAETVVETSITDEVVVEEVSIEEATLVEDVMLAVQADDEDTTAIKIAKSALAITIEEAKKCDSSIYTVSVLETLDEKIKKAEVEVSKVKVLVDGTYKYVKTSGDEGITYYENEGAFEEALNACKVALQEAIEGLEEGNLSELVEAIENAKALDKNGYDEQKLQAAIEAAEADLLELKEERIGYEQLSSKVQALTEAIAEAKKQDTDLINKIKEVEAITADDYTVTSYNALQRAIAIAKESLEKEGFNKEESDKQIKALEDAVKALVPIKALSEAIDMAKALKAADYTRHSWDALSRALYEAEKVLADAKDEDQALDEEDINPVTEALVNATKALVDISTLTSTYNEMVALNLTNPGAEDGAAETLVKYTASSWEAYNQALKEAETLLKNAKMANYDSIGKEDVEEAEKKLTKAVYGSEEEGMDGLVAIDELIGLIEEAASLTEKDYTADSWAAYIEAVNHAKSEIRTDKYGDIAVSKENVATEIEAVKKAHKALAKVTKGELKKIIAKAALVLEHKDYYVTDKDEEASQDEEYVRVTEETWESFEKEIAKAQKVADSEVATSKEVEAAIDGLNRQVEGVVNNPLTYDQIKELKEKISKINEVKPLAEEDYTVSTWSKYAAALSVAEELLDSEYPAKAALIKATADLTDAHQKLNLVTKNAFLNLIKDAKAYDAADYKEESFEALQKAIEKAEAFYKTLPITLTEQAKAETKLAYDELERAVNALEAKDVDTTSLKALVEEVENFNEFGFEAEADFESFETALAKAKEVLENSKALQPEVQEAYDDLFEAVEALKGKEVNVSTLEALMATLETLHETDYAVADWATLQEVVQAAEKLLAETEETVSEAIRDTQAALKEAIDGLNSYVKSKDAIKDLVDRAEAKNEKDYTISSWKGLVDKITAIKELVYNEKGEVDETKLSKVAISRLRNAEKELDAAVRALVVANEAAVKAALIEAKALEAADYTEESFAVLVEAITYAEEVILEGGPVSEYRASENALVEAMAGLVEAEKVPVEVPPSPEKFTEDLFENVMGRPASEEDKEFFKNAIEKDGWTGAQLVQHFTTVPEFTSKDLSDEEYIKSLYKMGFGREADAEGLAYWMGELAETNREIVLARILGSSEFNTFCETNGMKTGEVSINVGAQNFIKGVYTACLDREASVDEVMGWLKPLMDKTLTGSGLAGAFFVSPEFTGKERTDAEYVTVLYKAFFGAVHTDGVTYWTQQIEDGVFTRETALQFFAASEQFKAICDEAGIIR